MAKTSAQRYNDKMEKIFENAKKMKQKYAKLHAVQLLERLTEQAERFNSLHERKEEITEKDWYDLIITTRYAREVLEIVKPQVMESEKILDLSN